MINTTTLHACISLVVTCASIGIALVVDGVWFL
jgi:hypothetical protein